MRYLSENEFNEQMKHEVAMNKSRQRIQKLKEEKNKYKTPVKLPSTSKLIAAYLFIILNVVLIYAMIVMYEFRDLTYLGVLITDIAAQVLTYFIYAKKALAENCVNGIKYEIAMLEKQNELQLQAEEDVAG